MPLVPLTIRKKSPVREIVPTRVLVVDDEPLIQWSLSTALAAAGFDPICARSALDARRLASEWPPPRVAIIDVWPGGDVHELVDAIRSIYPPCTFIVMSTDGGDGDAAGVITLRKPFDLTEVVRLVRQSTAA